MIKNSVLLSKMLFSKFGLIGDGLGRFTCSELFQPIRFAQKEDGIVFLVTHIFSDTVFNTLRNTSKTRASKIINSMILPSMPAFHGSFKNTEIKYYGMLVTYGSEDFSEKDSVFNRRAEILAFVTPRDKCKQFVAGSIIDDEFVNDSEIYLQDRDIKFFKKVKVTLE
jgi:hypothetical protein